jgi:hypothetical protein
VVIAVQARINGVTKLVKFDTAAMNGAYLRKLWNARLAYGYPGDFLPLASFNLTALL